MRCRSYSDNRETETEYRTVQSHINRDVACRTVTVDTRSVTFYVLCFFFVFFLTSVITFHPDDVDDDNDDDSGPVITRSSVVYYVVFDISCDMMPW